MNFWKSLFSFLFLLCLSIKVHAENGCPPGMIPYSGTDINSCGPIPSGYYQGNQGQTQPGVRWLSKWGAIATDGVHGILGTKIKANSRQEAEEEATSDCKSKGGVDCKLQVVYSNGCGALVTGNSGFSTSYGNSVEEATEKAIKICSSDGDDGCHLYYSACSPPQQIP